MTSIPPSGFEIAKVQPRLPPPFNPRNAYIDDATRPVVKNAVTKFANDIIAQNAKHTDLPGARADLKQANAILNAVKSNPASVFVVFKEGGTVTSAAAYVRKGGDVELTALFGGGIEQRGLLNKVWATENPNKMTVWSSPLAAQSLRETGATIANNRTNADGLIQYVWTKQPSR